MEIRISSLEESPRNKWSGGETIQLHIEPEGLSVKDNFDWRISVATVNKGESEFSDFSKYNRYLTILEGKMEINQEGKLIEINELEELRFDGGIKTVGKCEANIMDFNIIWKKEIENFKIEVQKQDEKVENVNMGKEIFIFSLNQVVVEIGKKKIFLKKNQLIMIKDDSLISCSIKGKSIYGGIK